MRQKHSIEVITDTCLIVLPIDLLCLYFAGGWCEPNKIILVIELIMLPLISILGIIRIADYWRNPTQ